MTTDWLNSGITRLLDASGNGPIKGYDDLKEYYSAYDDCLWRIVTSSADDLGTLISQMQLWNEPLCNLPIPLAVTICRFYVLSAKPDAPEREAAITFISAHCSPQEEVGALDGVVRP